MTNQQVLDLLASIESRKLAIESTGNVPNSFEYRELNEFYPRLLKLREHLLKLPPGDLYDGHFQVDAIKAVSECADILMPKI